MPRTQELIHSLESGLLGRLVRLAALFLGVITMAVVFDLREYQNLRTEDAMDSAQLARNLAEGRGFTTRYVRPLSMGVLMRHSPAKDPQIKTEHPDIAQAPLYPLVLAGFMKIPGLFNHEMASPKEGFFRRHQPDLLITLINQGLYFVGIALTWFLARRLFDDKVAFLAAFMMLGCEALWQFSASGQPTMLALLLFLLLANLVTFLDEGSRREKPLGTGTMAALAAGAGLLCGLLLLTRYSFGVLILPLVAFLALGFPGRRAILPAAACLAFALVIAPWLIRNVQVCGNPFGIAPYSLVEETSVFTDNWLQRTLEPDLRDIGRDEIVRKFFLGASTLVRQELPAIGGTWLTAFFLAGLLVPFVNAGRTRLRWFTVGAILVLSIAQILARTHLSNDTQGINSENLLVITTPLVLVFGASLVYALVFSIELPAEAWRTLILYTITFVMWIPLLITFGPPKVNPVAYPPYYPPTLQRVAAWFQEDEMIMSDMPWAVAWYGNRQSLLLTKNPDEDFIQINDWQKTINGLHLSRITLDQRYISGWLLNARDWGRFVIEYLNRTRVPTGFPLRQAPDFLTTFPDHLLLADRIRWQETSPVAPPRALDKATPEGRAAAAGRETPGEPARRP